MHFVALQFNYRHVTTLLHTSGLPFLAARPSSTFSLPMQQLLQGLPTNTASRQKERDRPKSLPLTERDILGCAYSENSLIASMKPLILGLRN